MAKGLKVKKKQIKKVKPSAKRIRERPKKAKIEVETKPLMVKKSRGRPKNITVQEKSNEHTSIVVPNEAGYHFTDEKSLLAFASSSDSHKRRILNMTHTVENIEELSKLKFDWNNRPVDKSHVNTLSSSIRKRGLMEPIFIALDISSLTPVMQVVRGRHRSEALKQLRDENKKEGSIPEKRLMLPAKVIFYEGSEDYFSDKKQRWADIASNIQELTKKDHIIARADTFAQIQTDLISTNKKEKGKLQRGSGPVSSVAVSLGLAKSTVRSALNVRNLPEGLREAIRNSLEMAISLRAKAKTDRERKKIKDIPEKFLYKIAGNYNRVKIDYERELKERAMDELGISYEIKKFKGPGGRELQKNLIPEAQRSKVKERVDELIVENLKELTKRQHDKEKELIKLVEQEASIKAGVTKKKKSESVPAKRTKIDISDLKSALAELTDKEADKLLKSLKKKGLDI